MPTAMSEMKDATRLTREPDNSTDSDHRDHRDTFTVVFTECSTGLGIKIIGGLGEEDGDLDYGIFIHKVLPGGLAHQQGQLQEGDQLFSVNDQGLENVTNDEAVQLLRDASAADYIKLTVIRDDTALEEYDDLLQAYSYSSASSVCDQHTASSRNSLMSPPTTEGWTSPLTAGYVCDPGAKRAATAQSQRQRCEGSSSGSEDGGGILDPSVSPHHLFQGSSISPQLHYGHHHPHLARATGLGDQNYILAARPALTHPRLAQSGSNHQNLLKQPKIPNAAAAAASTQLGLHMIPTLSSTPQHLHYGYHTKPSPPDGASGGTPDTSGYQLSPVMVQDTLVHVPEASPLHTLPGSSGYGHSEYSTPRSTARGSPRDRLNSKLSLDPQVRLKVEKLQMALKYLGIDPKPEEQVELRKRLEVDTNGMVTYKQFVEVARELFQFHLEAKNFSPSAMMFASNDIKDFTDPPAFVPELSQIMDTEPSDELRRENDSLKQEVRKLKKLLREKEDELIRIRQDAHGALHESQSLRSKVHLVEQAQRAARNMEQDYEEVVRLLESEILELRRQSIKQVENPALQQRMAVLGCQLRKAEVTKKTYEVATDKLLQFTEVVRDTLSGQGETSRPVSAVSQGGTRGSHPPGYVQKKSSVKTLATEAQDVVKAVKSLLEVEPLPFGWEEAYTADGMKYFINHITQVTTWQHPLSNVLQEVPKVTAGHDGNHGNKTKGNRPKAANQASRGKLLPSIHVVAANQSKANQASKAEKS